MRLVRVVRELVYGLQDGLSGRLLPWEGARCSSAAKLYMCAYDVSLMMRYRLRGLL